MYSQPSIELPLNAIDPFVGKSTLLQRQIFRLIQQSDDWPHSNFDCLSVGQRKLLQAIFWNCVTLQGCVTLYDSASTSQLLVCPQKHHNAAPSETPQCSSFNVASALLAIAYACISFSASCVLCASPLSLCVSFSASFVLCASPLSLCVSFGYLCVSPCCLSNTFSASLLCILSLLPNYPSMQ